jgi:hypothetical protein
METTETSGQSFTPPTLNIDFQAQGYLKSAGRWATFLGILGFVACGIIFIVAFFAGAIFSRVGGASYGPLAALTAGAGWLITFFYLLIDVFYFFFSLYLYQFGDRIKKGIDRWDNISVTVAFEKLKSFFKLWGITTIVVISLYLLIIVGFIAFGILAATSHSLN